MTVTRDSVAVIGAGHVGLPFAAYLSSKGLEVMLVDLPSRIASLRRGQTGFSEPGLEEQLVSAQRAGRLCLTDDVDDLLGTAVCFVCVGSTAARGEINGDTLRSVVSSLPDRYDGELVIRSTVPVGTCRALSEQLSTKIWYLPEFLREGSSLSDLAATNVMTVGTGRAEVPELLLATLNWVRFELSSWETVEALKIYSNVLNYVRVALANELGAIWSGCHSVDFEFISRHLIDPTRLSMYSRPGLPPGGSCLPLAVRHVRALAEAKQVDVPLIESLELSSRQQIIRLANRISRMQPISLNLTNVAFKDGTDDASESPIVALVEQLRFCGIDVNVEPGRGGMQEGQWGVVRIRLRDGSFTSWNINGAST